MLHQPGAGERADAFNLKQFGLPVANLSSLAMVGDGEAMRFVANFLHQVQNRRAAIEDDWFVLLAIAGK